MLIGAANPSRIMCDPRKAKAADRLAGHPRSRPVEEAGIVCTRFAQTAKTGPIVDTRLIKRPHFHFRGDSAL